MGLSSDLVAELSLSLLTGVVSMDWKEHLSAFVKELRNSSKYSVETTFPDH